MAEDTTVDLVALIRGSMNNARTISAREVLDSKKRLRQRVDRLELLLNREGSNGAGWKRYLKVDQLQLQLNDGATSDLAKLKAIHERFASDAPGLERSEIVDIRRALRSHCELLATHKTPVSGDEYKVRLNLLAQGLSNYSKQPNSKDQQDVEDHLGWLKARGQATHLVSAIRNRFSHPNFVVTVSRRAIEEGLRQVVDEENQINENILGAQVTGRGRMIGKSWFTLVPDTNQAALQLHFSGTNSTQTVARQGPVQVYNTGQTLQNAEARIFLDERGARAEKTRSTATTTTQIIGISTKFRRRIDRLVKRIAWRKAAKAKEKSERVASARSAEDLNQQIDGQIGQLAAQLNAQYLKSIRNPLLRCDQFPRRVDCQTTPDLLKISVVQQDPLQLAAPQAAQSLTAESDLAIWLHESMVNNLATRLLAGKTMTWSELLGLWNILNGRFEPTQLPPGAKGLSVTFDEENPIDFSIQRGVISLTVHGTRYKLNGGDYPSMDIVIRYKLEMPETGTRLVMLGDPKVTLPPHRKSETVSQSLKDAAQRNYLKNLISRDLDKQIALEPIAPSGDWSSLGKFSIAQATAEGGWLTIAYQRDNSDNSR